MHAHLFRRENCKEKIAVKNYWRYKCDGGKICNKLQMRQLHQDSSIWMMILLKMQLGKNWGDRMNFPILAVGVWGSLNLQLLSTLTFSLSI